MDSVLPEQCLAEKSISSAAEGFESPERISPLGATVVSGGVNFSVFSTRVYLKKGEGIWKA